MSRIRGQNVIYTPKQTTQYEKLVRARCVAALDNSHPNFDACLKTLDMRQYNVRTNTSGGSPPVSKIFFDKDTPLEISIIALFSIPKSVGKNFKNSMLAGNILPTKKPDSDNIIKIILDALNGLAYWDDSQVCRVYFEKKYAEIPETRVLIKNFEES